jgi:threonylcarbamoyladenosine tRNA methylthiotransferase CDKAL1
MSGPSEQSFVNEINKAKKDGKHLVLAGCVPQGSLTNTAWKDLSIIGVQQIDRIVEVVSETLEGNAVSFTKVRKRNGEKGKDGGARLDMPKLRRNPYIEVIPINTGCLNQCTYCKTKHARGDLGSYAPQEIWDRVESVIKEGVVEIWLTSEDLGAYGHDINVTITTLLWGIIESMERADPDFLNGVMLRVGMVCAFDLKFRPTLLTY